MCSSPCDEHVAEGLDQELARQAANYGDSDAAPLMRTLVALPSRRVPRVMRTDLMLPSPSRLSNPITAHVMRAVSWLALWRL